MNMKRVKSLAGLIPALVLMFNLLSVTALASDSGSITVSNATAGVTYQAYKILDATVSGDKTAYTTTAALKDVLGETGSPFTVADVADEQGNYSVTVAEGVSGDVISGWLKAHSEYFHPISATSGTDASGRATGTEVCFTGLAYGYYYVTSSLGAEVTVDSAAPSVVVYDKNMQAPNSVDKKLTAEKAAYQQSAQENLSTDINDAAVGTVQSYAVTFHATNWVTEQTSDGIQTEKVTKYTVCDTPTNLTVDKSSVNVVVTDATGDKTVIQNGVASGDAYPATVSLDAGDEKPLTVELDWVKNGESIYQATDGKPEILVTLTYQAEVLAGGADSGAVNHAAVTYNGDKPVGTDETRTHTYKFRLEKVDGDGNPLTGAKFALYLGTEIINLIAVDDGYRVAEAGEPGAVATIDMTNVSQVVIKGLDKQEYILKEVLAPDGYKLLDADMKVFEDTLIAGTDPIPEGDQAPGAVTVRNQHSLKLPFTGGGGTVALYVVGAALALGAVIVLVVRNRLRKAGKAQS